MLRTLLFSLVLLGAVPAHSALKTGESYIVDYEFFSVELDCDTRSATRWWYVTLKDLGNFKRSDEFYYDPSVPSRCQQKSQSTYRNHSKVSYDRGHLVPANSMDFSALAIVQSNSMVNVLPQVAQMNRGAWYQTELWEECRRDLYQMTVYGGVYRDDSAPIPQGGDFTRTHGVTAPQAFWKVITYDGNVIAWWIPNSVNAVASNVDTYLVSVRDIEQWTGQSIEIDPFLKDFKSASTNAMLAGCDKS
ncbi:DNA/RNA non-specific endonuclease [Vibrio sp. Hal054]|uniref:DNA/RNA non-specific endonuclease n=1 Tax=Vibrio sp. Hal054 TaxID=3035158 RepID=UPI00301C2256